MSRAYPGDEVFFHKSGRAVSGKVLASGRHGCTIDHDGKQHKVKWEHIAGHKSRAKQSFKLVEQGDDGVIVEDKRGNRHYFKSGQRDEK